MAPEDDNNNKQHGEREGEGGAVGAVIMIIVELNSHRGPTCDGMHGGI